MYARLHIWKQIEVFSFHWYYKTYKLENEFASVYPLMLFAEFDATKTCRVGVGWEWESKHWLNNIEAFVTTIYSVSTIKTKFICRGRWNIFKWKKRLVYEMEHYLLTYSTAVCFLLLRSQVTVGRGLPPVTTHSNVPPRVSIMSAAAAGLEMATTEGSTGVK